MKKGTGSATSCIFARPKPRWLRCLSPFSWMSVCPTVFAPRVEPPGCLPADGSKRDCPGKAFVAESVLPAVDYTENVRWPNFGMLPSMADYDKVYACILPVWQTGSGKKGTGSEPQTIPNPLGNVAARCLSPFSTARHGDGYSHQPEARARSEDVDNSRRSWSAALARLVCASGWYEAAKARCLQQVATRERLAALLRYCVS